VSLAIRQYEELSRSAGQSMTKYIAEWREAESALIDAGIAGYAKEVRAARLLDGA